MWNRGSCTYTRSVAAVGGDSDVAAVAEGFVDGVEDALVKGRLDLVLGAVQVAQELEHDGTGGDFDADGGQRDGDVQAQHEAVLVQRRVHADA